MLHFHDGDCLLKKLGFLHLLLKIHTPARLVAAETFVMTSNYLSCSTGLQAKTTCSGLVETTTVALELLWLLGTSLQLNL